MALVPCLPEVSIRTSYEVRETGAKPGVFIGQYKTYWEERVTVIEITGFMDSDIMETLSLPLV